MVGVLFLYQINIPSKGIDNFSPTLYENGWTFSYDNYKLLNE